MKNKSKFNLEKLKEKAKEIKETKNETLFHKANFLFNSINNLSPELAQEIMKETGFLNIIEAAKSVVQNSINKDGLKYIFSDDFKSFLLVFNDEKKDAKVNCFDIEFYSRSLSKDNDLNEIFILGALCNQEIFEIIQVFEAISN